ncbi:ImmA/IrrE family metallo-endopeptidase [Halobacteriovorax sp. CON-3]|uniref:ImmA/IrrE family metallo-endopeptidase n=1 Tax=Halobacteriovorax sp. CON-3 TaxID=3157710 RepID=UPI003721D5D5
MLSSRKRQIKRIADNLWRENNLTPGFDIHDLLERKDIIFRAENLEDGVSGALLVDGDLKIITVSRSDGPQRQRFTIAHELGHEALHDGFSVSVSSTAKEYYRNTKSSTGEYEKEIEANFFAACLLMPEDAILEEIHHDEAIDDNRISQLATIFNVSQMAMAIRLSSLGFV